MNKLDISSVLYYGRSFDEDDIGYYINLDNLKIYSRQSLISGYNFTGKMLSNVELLCDTYRFAPLFHVNVVDEMRNFLDNLNNRRISKEIMALNSEQLYIYFQKHMELNFGDHQRWREQEKQCLTTAAVNWCKQYHIPYVL